MIGLLLAIAAIYFYNEANPSPSSSGAPEGSLASIVGIQEVNPPQAIPIEIFKLGFPSSAAGASLPSGSSGGSTGGVFSGFSHPRIVLNPGP